MRFGWLCILILCPLLLGAQEKKHRIVFYNVENLFDTVDDPVVADEEFTPSGAKHWTEHRYRDKLSKIARAIRETGGETWPCLVGLAEVENRSVLNELIKQADLQSGEYGIVHQDSPDSRGIDVAFLYRKSLFRPLDSAFFKINFPTDPGLTTRDILYVAGVLETDTLHCFVCHFPSMYGGEKKSEWKRIRVAQILRMQVDSIRKINPAAKIVIMGDLNGKANTEAQRILGSKSSEQQIYLSDSLYNTGYYLLGKEYGSYRYRGVWQTLDHIIVSGSLLKEKSRKLRVDKKLTVFFEPFLLEEDKKNSGNKPRPTYRGPFYIGGCSDHLPIYIDLHYLK